MFHPHCKLKHTYACFAMTGICRILGLSQASLLSRSLEKRSSGLTLGPQCVSQLPSIGGLMPMLVLYSQPPPQQGFTSAETYPPLVAWILTLEFCLQSSALLQLACPIYQCVPLIGLGELCHCLTYRPGVP